DELSWYQHALNYITRRRKGLAGKSMRAIAGTPAPPPPGLLVPGQRRSGGRPIPGALYCRAVRGKEDPPQGDAEGRRWVAGHSRPLSDLASQDLMLDVLDAISCKLDSTPAAANTVARKRAVLSNVLDYGVGRGLNANPLTAAAKAWAPPKTTEDMVDP